MPKYIDFHAKMPQLPPEAVKKLQAEFKSGRRDQYGVKAINAYFADDGKAWCVSEADSPEAVCKSHAAHGLDLEKGDVHEVKSVV